MLGITYGVSAATNALASKQACDLARSLALPGAAGLARQDGTHPMASCQAGRLPVSPWIWASRVKMDIRLVRARIRLVRARIRLVSQFCQTRSRDTGFESHCKYSFPNCSRSKARDRAHAGTGGGRPAPGGPLKHPRVPECFAWR